MDYIGVYIMVLSKILFCLLQDGCKVWAWGCRVQEPYDMPFRLIEASRPPKPELEACNPELGTCLMHPEPPSTSKRKSWALTFFFLVCVGFKSVGLCLGFKSVGLCLAKRSQRSGVKYAGWKLARGAQSRICAELKCYRCSNR